MTHRYSQVVKDLSAVAPAIGIAILPLALIVEPIYLPAKNPCAQCAALKYAKALLAPTSMLALSSGQAA